jgi:hypothetical protein
MWVWSAICIVLGAAGLVSSYFIWRKKGALRGIRAIAWSLIPLAAYLTGASTLLSRIGSAIARFSGAFVFSPKTWLGVIFLGLAVLLFLTSGGLPLLKRGRRRAKVKDDQAAAEAGAQGRTAIQAPTKAGRGKANADSELEEIEAILQRRGIK